jgi:hypothetical protein
METSFRNIVTLLRDVEILLRDIGPLLQGIATLLRNIEALSKRIETLLRGIGPLLLMLERRESAPRGVMVESAGKNSWDNTTSATASSSPTGA